ncbi:unnamed protein product [Fusarium graminearum]|nr:unnamed protein product [Fusarium graminearum]
MLYLDILWNFIGIWSLSLTYQMPKNLPETANTVSDAMVKRPQPTSLVVPSTEELMYWHPIR